MAKNLLKCNHDILMRDEGWSTSKGKASLEMFLSSSRRPPGGRRAQGTGRCSPQLLSTSSSASLATTSRLHASYKKLPQQPWKILYDCKNMRICFMIKWLQLYRCKSINMQVLYSSLFIFFFLNSATINWNAKSLVNWDNERHNSKYNIQSHSDTLIILYTFSMWSMH